MGGFGEGREAGGRRGGRVEARKDGRRRRRGQVRYVSVGSEIMKWRRREELGTNLLSVVLFEFDLVLLSRSTMDEVETGEGSEDY